MKDDNLVTYWALMWRLFQLHGFYCGHGQNLRKEYDFSRVWKDPWMI